MPSQSHLPRALGRRRSLTLLVLFIAASLGQDVQERTLPVERPGAFVRKASRCGECHEIEHEAILAGVHAQVPVSRGLDACETCHGPGKKHSDNEDPADITHPGKLTGAQQKALCARCHARQIREHGGPLSVLERARKQCMDCHYVHEKLRDIPGHEDPRGFATRTAANAHGKAIGLTKCLACHEDRARSLANATHSGLLVRKRLEDGRAWSKEETCEACHGNGQKHAETYGVARFITRPDLALDGNASCRSCHGDVDPETFHWRRVGKQGSKTSWFGPLLGRSAGRKLSCTACHRVHSPDDPALHRGERASTPRAASRPSTKSKRSHGVNTELDAATDPLACASCHAPAYRVLQGTIHASLASAAQEPGTGCISCHPGGGWHAKRGGQRGTVLSLSGREATVQTAACMGCHARDRELAGYARGIHAKRRITCLSCHSPAARSGKVNMVKDAEKNCAECHAAVASSFRHANRHPVGEGSFACSSCHDPHTQKRVGLRTARKASKHCTSCHKEYRGPFVFPHHAMKGEGCLACHVPHGTTNTKLLETKTVRQTCLACHADLPNFHDQSQGSVYRNCLSCHFKVHGSNRNRFFFR